MRDFGLPARLKWGIVEALDALDSRSYKDSALALPLTIAVDGPAGSGKSSISFALAQRLGYLFVDTGALPRRHLLALEQGTDFTDPAALTRLAENARLSLSGDLRDDGRQYTILADERDITPHINSPEVDAHVSIVAAVPGSALALLELQRSIAARGRVIMAGRDIGTVVLPDADLKLYVTHRSRARALRGTTPPRRAARRPRRDPRRAEQP